MYEVWSWQCVGSYLTSLLFKWNIREADSETTCIKEKIIPNCQMNSRSWYLPLNSGYGCLIINDQWSKYLKEKQKHDQLNCHDNIIHSICCCQMPAQNITTFEKLLQDSENLQWIWLTNQLQPLEYPLNYSTRITTAWNPCFVIIYSNCIW